MYDSVANTAIDSIPVKVNYHNLKPNISYTILCIALNDNRKKRTKCPFGIMADRRNLVASGRGGHALHLSRPGLDTTCYYMVYSNLFLPAAWLFGFGE